MVLFFLKHMFKEKDKMTYFISPCFVHIKTKFKFCKINKIPKNNSYSSGFNFLRGKLRLHPHLLSPGCWVTHLSTAIAWREKNSKHFVFCKYFCLILGLLKSRISKKYLEGLGRKLDFKLFHYKTRVQSVSKTTTIATRIRC